MITLKSFPGALQNWLVSEHPHIPPNYVHFAEGGINQTTLNPFSSQIIVVYNVSNQRIHLFGWIMYGSEEMLDLQLLSTVTVSKSVLQINPPIDDSDNVTLDQIKAHLGGTYFSIETLKVILTIMPYAKGLSQFIKREMDRVDLTLHLSRFSEFLELMDEEEVTLADYQRDFNRRAKPYQLIPFPRLFFKVPIDQYIPGTGHPLYLGGFFHVSEYEMNAWIWRHLTHHCAVKRPGIVHPEQMLHVIAYMNDLRKEKRKHVSIQLDQVDRYLPPCMRRILYETGKFPKDTERQQLVRILARANVPIEFIEDRLGKLNEMDPHESGKMELRKRWDYKAHYKAGYSPPSCEAMNCPLAPGKDLATKKSQCYILYTRTFLEKPVPHPKSFYGPIKWFEW